LSRFFAHSIFFPAPWLVGIPVGAVLAVLGPLMGGFAPVVNLAFIVLMAAIFLLCVIPSRIVVGSDGIEHRWLFWRRFFPLREVRALERMFAIPARLILRDGRNALLPYTFSPRNDLLGKRSKALLAIDRAIAWAAAQPAVEAPEATSVLPRAGEALEAWRTRVAGEGYRSQPVSTEALWRIVDDPWQTADVRGAAAVLLAPGGDAGVRARIAEVADATANTRLRVLLDGAAQGQSDEEVESRFDKLATRAHGKRS
jgi:hypothetical protein